MHIICNENNDTSHLLLVLQIHEHVIPMKYVSHKS